MSNALPDYIAEISTLMEVHLRVRGRDLNRQVRRAGRLLPRSVRRDLDYLIQSARIAENPKLARMVDPAKLAAAHARVVAHLQDRDPRAVFWDSVTGIAASAAVAVLVLLAAVLFLLARRDVI